MRLRNNPEAKNILKASQYVIDKKRKQYFPNNNETHLEIGVGKGDFIIGMAKQYPHLNFIGIEKYASVLVKAAQKIANENLDNVLLLNIDARALLDYFEQNSFKTIYLNFSDPWPKQRHYKRRLTYRLFLTIYQQLLTVGGSIKQKTDNQSLFESSIISYNDYEMKIEMISVDLHHSEYAKDNVMSEYERKFALKQPIYAIEVSYR